MSSDAVMYVTNRGVIGELKALPDIDAQSLNAAEFVGCSESFHLAAMNRHN
jgi:hypothetical protein